MKYIDVTPTPEQYRRALRSLIANSTNKNDIEWAKRELKRFKNVKKWKKQ